MSNYRRVSKKGYKQVCKAVRSFSDSLDLKWDGATPHEDHAASGRQGVAL